MPAGVAEKTSFQLASWVVAHRDFPCFPTCARRADPRNRRSVVALHMEAADSADEHSDPSDKFAFCGLYSGEKSSFFTY